jgi:hypothetical protein
MTSIAVQLEELRDTVGESRMIGDPVDDVAISAGEVRLPVARGSSLRNAGHWSF